MPGAGQDIFNIIGGSRFRKAVQAVWMKPLPTGVEFPHKQGRQGMNHCRITLDKNGTYYMEFFKMQERFPTLVLTKEAIPGTELAKHFKRATGINPIPRVAKADKKEAE